MCGICGITDFTGRPIKPSEIMEMRDVMKRRGPDSAGIEVMRHVGLGHRRLSIIDLTETGNQPMSNEDRSIWVMLNGEIYGFQSLRDELARKGHRFKSSSDTEVLLHGYEQYGIEKLLERTNGMFAFAIWDGKKEELLLARDRLGKKPLYYGSWGERFFFSSDIKSLWLASGKTLRIAYDSIARFLYWGYIPGPHTVFNSVFQLMPGTYVRVSRERIEEKSYWTLSFGHKQSISWNEAIEAVDQELKEAVARRLYSDVPLGAFLSGGVDSSLVVQYMSKIAEEQVRTFSVGFDEEEHDERAFARRVASHCGTRHVEEMVHADVKTLLPSLIWEFGQPFGDAAAITTSEVARIARKHVIVGCTGDGGDESFAGYSQHQGRVIGNLLGKLVPSRVLEFGVDRTQRSHPRNKHSPLAPLRRLLRYASSKPVANLSTIDFWNWGQLTALWPRGLGTLYDATGLVQHAINVLEEFDGDNPLDKALHLDLKTQLPFCYNVKLDVATMFNSLEARCPFMDYRVVELAARLPWHFKLGFWERKHLLKSLASMYLPREVIYRRKHGFSLPMDDWMEHSWVPLVEEVVFGNESRNRGLFSFGYLQELWEKHRSGRERHGYRFWLLLWLELWFQMVIDGTRSVSDPLS